MVLGWFENLPKDEVPPRHTWWSGDLLDAWFKDVEERREKKMSSGGKKKSTYDEADETPSMGNQLLDRDEYIPR